MRLEISWERERESEYGLRLSGCMPLQPKRSVNDIQNTSYTSARGREVAINCFYVIVIVSSTRLVWMNHYIIGSHFLIMAGFDVITFLIFSLVIFTHEIKEIMKRIFVVMSSDSMRFPLLSFRGKVFQKTT